VIVIAPAVATIMLPFLEEAGPPEITDGQALLASGLFAALLLGLGLLQIPLGRKIATWLERPFVPSRKAFQLVDLVAVFILFIAGNIAAAAACNRWYEGEWGMPSEEFLVDLGGIAMFTLTTFGQLPAALYIVFVAVRRSGGLAALGVKRLTAGARVRYTVARYILALPMIFGLAALTSFIYLLAGEELATQGAALVIAEGLESDPLLIFLFAAVLIPLLEEILFRGFLLELLVARGGKLFGIVASSALFAWMHGSEVFLPIFGLAVVLAVVKLRTRSLGAAWLVHGLHNGSTTAFLYFYAGSPLLGNP